MCTSFTIKFNTRLFAIRECVERKKNSSSAQTINVCPIGAIIIWTGGGGEYWPRLWLSVRRRITVSFHFNYTWSIWRGYCPKKMYSLIVVKHFARISDNVLTMCVHFTYQQKYCKIRYSINGKIRCQFIFIDLVPSSPFKSQSP